MNYGGINEYNYTVLYSMEVSVYVITMYFIQLLYVCSVTLDALSFILLNVRKMVRI